MTEPDGGGQGTQGTYLSGAPARVSIRSDARLAAMAPAAAEEIDILTTNVDLLEYWIDERGVPQGYPPFGAILRVVGGTGVPQYSDVPPQAADVDLGADARWLPTDGSFTPDGTWTAQIGGMQLISPGGDVPYLDTGYSHAVRGGDEVSHNAVVIDGDSWMQLDADALTAGAFTLILVAVFHPNFEGPDYAIVESSTTDEDGEAVADWGLRYEGGILRLNAGTVRAQHPLVFPQGRAVFIAIAMDQVQAKLVVASKTKTTSAFSTSGINVFDLSLYLGRGGGSLVNNETAQMDVLEASFYGTSLGFDEIAGKLHLLDAVYGIVG